MPDQPIAETARETTHDITELYDVSPATLTSPQFSPLRVPLLETRPLQSPLHNENRNYSVATANSVCTCTCTCGAPSIANRTNSQGSRRRHSIPTGPIPQGIYWWSPAGMIGFFLCGIVFSIAHHAYYESLDGRRVGNDQEQQWAIRYGSTFAYIVQTSLVCSVGYSFTQTLWKTLKRKKVSVKALDAAFEADRTIWSLRNPEMLWKLRLVSFLCIVSWCLPLPSLVTPATLFVLPSSQETWSQGNVSALDMSGSQWSRFAYSVNATASSPLFFLGPRTVISRLSTATATQGKILDITPPSTNSSYSLQFNGPAVQCQDADATTAGIIDALRDQAVANYTGDVIEYMNNYFAFVPDLSDFRNDTSATKGVQMVSQTRLQAPSSASNELWMVYSRYVWDSTGARSTLDHYTTCKLYNASYDVDFSFNNGSQNITMNNITMLNAIEYPSNTAPNTTTIQQQHAFSAVFWALSDLIVGSMGVFTEYPNNRSISTNFTEITTQIEHTSLLGSSDLDVFFDNSHFLYSASTVIGDQRREDIELAQNKTLDVLIEELALNTTISFMSSHKLSPNSTANVTDTLPINIYAYHAHNLLYAYTLAILFTLIANLLGAYSYYRNEYAHNKSFSAILAATRDEDLAELFFADMMGRLPLHRDVERAELRFGDMEGGGLGFREDPPRPRRLEEQWQVGGERGREGGRWVWVEDAERGDAMEV